MNTKEVGEISQAVVIAELVKRGIPVSIPFGDNQRYDLIMDYGKLYKVQIKTANFKEGYIEFATSSSSTHRGRGRQDYRGQVDLFIAYCHQLDKVYLVPIEEASGTTMKLRLTAPKNGQIKGINWAEGYELDKQIILMPSNSVVE